jgi:hypothetical protein
MAVNRPQRYARKDQWKNIPWQQDDPDRISGWEIAMWCLCAVVIAWLAYSW